MLEILVWLAFTSIYGMMVVRKHFDPIGETIASRWMEWCGLWIALTCAT